MAAVPELGRAAGVEPRAVPGAAATTDLYERYSGQIYAFCFQQLRNREEAEDAVQTTFLNAFRGLSRGISPEAEQAWLYKIAHNVCLTRRRSSYRRGRVETPGDMQALQDFVAAPQRMGADELIELQEALAAMPSSQRKAILLREWRGLSYREIADEMGLSQAAVETLIFRARRSLANGLEQQPQERKKLLKRLRHALDLGTLLTALKGAIAGGAAVKAAATAAAVTSVAAVATVPSDERVPRRGPVERPAAAVAPPAEVEPAAPALAARAVPPVGIVAVRIDRGPQPRIVAVPAQRPKPRAQAPADATPPAAKPALAPAAAEPAAAAPEAATPAVPAPAAAVEPARDEPKAEPRKAEEPKAEQPKAEPRKAEQPKAEQPRAEQPRAEQPKAEQPKAEQSKGQLRKFEEPPKAEEPKPAQRETSGRAAGAGAPESEEAKAEPQHDPAKHEAKAEAKAEAPKHETRDEVKAAKADAEPDAAAAPTQQPADPAGGRSGSGKK